MKLLKMKCNNCNQYSSLQTSDTSFSGLTLVVGQIVTEGKYISLNG
jgi:hypothetical protein